MTQSDQLSFNRTDLDVARARAGFRSQAALARAAGVAEGHLRQIGLGFIPSEPTRQKIAAALGVQPERIWKPKKRRTALSKTDERTDRAA